jgi:branched-chain amino acid transport system permease protein
MIFTVLGLGLNVVPGWTGLLDLGASGFIALGAYLTGILMKDLGFPFWSCLIISAVHGCIWGILLGLPTLRHTKDYFAILTLGFSELVVLLIKNWPSLTRGTYGFTGIPPVEIPFLGITDGRFTFGMVSLSVFNPVGYWYIGFLLIIILYFALLRFKQSHYGLALYAIKHSVPMAQASGINIIRYKLLAFSLSASILSIGGTLWAIYQRTITWSEFTIVLSFALLTIVIVGGVGSLKGVILGSVALGLLMELIRTGLTSFGLPPSSRYLIFAITLIAVIRWKPRGILPDIPRWSTSSLIVDLPKEKKIEQYSQNNSIVSSSLKLESLRKSYGELVVLDNISLTIKNGETVAILGPNGAGKTTLIDIVSGFRRPTSGNILYNNHSLLNLTPDQIMKHGIARTFQSVTTIDELSPFDNILVGLHSNLSHEKKLSLRSLISHRISPNTTLQVVEILDQISIPTKLWFEPSKNLSYGEKKLLDLGRCLAVNGSLLLLDEPGAGQSPSEINRLVTILKHICDSFGVTLIFIAHEMSLVHSLADRILLLDHGKVIEDGPVDILQTSEKVQHSYFGIN